MINEMGIKIKNSDKAGELLCIYKTTLHDLITFNDHPTTPHQRIMGINIKTNELDTPIQLWNVYPQSKNETHHKLILTLEKTAHSILMGDLNNYFDHDKDKNST